MIVIAIKNFFKDFFVVEVEEEVPAKTEQRETNSVSNGGGPEKVEQKDRKSNVTQLDLSRNDKKSSDNQEEETTKRVETKQRPFFKKERQKSASGKAAKRENNPTDNYKETTLMNAENTNAKVHLFEPRVFSETQDIADELKNERATLVNLSKVDAGPKKRIVDFLSGTVYALDGDIQKVGNDIFLCTPKSVIVEGEISSDKESLEEM